MNPFKYRPPHLTRDPELPEAPDDIEWEDNAVSNFMAYVSQTRLLEPMCNEEHYISSKIANYFYTSCPCCLFYRGLTVGFILGNIFMFAIGLIGIWLWL